MKTRRQLINAGVALTFTLIGFVSISAAAEDEGKTKQLFLYNLAKYVSWPEDAFRSAEAPIVIGVVGDPNFAEELAEMVDGHRAQDRELRVITLDPGVPAEGVHVVYFPDRDYGRLREQANLYSDGKAIRVAEHQRFAKVGDIGFVMKSGRVSFYVNELNARRGGTRLSSKFMRLASGVE